MTRQIDQNYQNFILFLKNKSSDVPIYVVVFIVNYQISQIKLNVYRNSAVFFVDPFQKIPLAHLFSREIATHSISTLRSASEQFNHVSRVSTNEPFTGCHKATSEVM